MRRRLLQTTLGSTRTESAQQTRCSHGQYGFGVLCPHGRIYDFGPVAAPDKSLHTPPLRLKSLSAIRLATEIPRRWRKAERSALRSRPEERPRRGHFLRY